MLSASYQKIHFPVWWCITILEFKAIILTELLIKPNLPSSKVRIVANSEIPIAIYCKLTPRKTHHHHVPKGLGVFHVPKGLGVFHVPYSSR